MITVNLFSEKPGEVNKFLSHFYNTNLELNTALKLIPTPEEPIEPVVEEKVEEVANPIETEENKEYLEQTRVEVKPSLWQRIKNSKFVKAISYIMKIKVIVEVPNALPEGRGENN